MKPLKPERRRFIIYAFFFVLFLCAVASINEIRFDNILNFGGCPSISATSATLNSTSDGDVRIFIGILTLPEKYHRRHLLRMVYNSQSPAGAKVDVKFVFCNLTTEEQQVMVALEIMQYDDIIILNCSENMNEGKTYTYFSSLPEMMSSSDAPSSPPYHYVMKVCYSLSCVHNP